MPADFLIAGVQKAGTTAMHAVLSRHPQIFMPAQKEVHYFDNERTVNWDCPAHTSYEKLFILRKPGQICGEATPAYIYWPNSIERIAAYNSSIKLIVILRNPIERAYSHWVMEYTVGREWLSFSEAIRKGRSRVSTDKKSHLGHHKNFSYVERGFYASQLARVYSYFPKDQVLVMLHDDMRQQPRVFLAHVAEFLDIGTIDDTRLSRYFSPYRRQLDLATIDRGDADYLSNVFREDVRELGEMIEGDLSKWAIA